MTDVIERGPEHIPTPEEVLGLFKEMVGVECTEVLEKRVVDDKGILRRLDAVAPGREKGERTELNYTNTNGAVVHTMYYKEGDDWGPQGPQANLVDGEWVIKP